MFSTCCHSPSWTISSTACHEPRGLTTLSGRTEYLVILLRSRSERRIPTVYNAFRGQGYYFIVMEKVAFPGGQQLCFRGICRTIQMPSVPDPIFGRISIRKACVWHPVPGAGTLRQLRNGRQVHQQGMNHSSLLNHFLPQVLSCCQCCVSLSDELSICHSDIRKSNFLLDVKAGRLYVVDFQHISVLPKSFQGYGFFNIGCSFAAAVVSHLQVDYQPLLPDIAEAMTRALGLL